MPWNPDRYHKFQSQRTAPFNDLLGLVNVRPGLKVVDLGCGTGELTRRLADALPDSDVLGLDKSPHMLERAADYARAGLRFELGDLASLPASWDLIFSNAALQWSPDHPALVSNLFAQLDPGGQMAVQVPSNHTHVSHRLIIETAQEEPFRSALDGWVRRSPVLSIEAYAQLFYDLGAENILVFEKIYPHVLPDAEAVLEWVSGTALIPYFERLGDLKDNFLAALRGKLHSALPSSPVFYPFRRILFSVRNPA
ncbi:MAG: methyltransferase domain-containing protein [Chloroflexi bacterium]|nr:methyltransferase domain-containing protein [Chloroflexota bacterium]